MTDVDCISSFSQIEQIDWDVLRDFHRGLEACSAERVWRTLVERVVYLLGKRTGFPITILTLIKRLTAVAG